MFAVAALALFVAMVLVLIRLYLGPTLYDRVFSGEFLRDPYSFVYRCAGFFDGQTRFSGTLLFYTR